MDTKMFLDKYPHWEVEGLHCPLTLQEMFLHCCSLGKKGGRMNDPPRPPAWPPTFRPAGRYLHCPISGATGPAEKRSGTSIIKCTNLGDCPDLCCAGWNGQVN